MESTFFSAHQLAHFHQADSKHPIEDSLQHPVISFAADSDIHEFDNLCLKLSTSPTLGCCWLSKGEFFLRDFGKRIGF